MTGVKRVVPVRRARYTGDRSDTVGQVVGPDRRGIYWRGTHAEYDADSDTTEVVFRPMPAADMERIFAPLGGADAVRERLAAEGKLGVAGV